MRADDFRSWRLARGGQRGVTLLEVLITLVVVALGVLGMVAMQSVSITNAQGSHHYTLATVIAYDALDRVRVEMDGTTDTGGVPAATLNAVAATYNDARFTGRFPGALTVTLAADGNDVVVTVSWQDDRLGVETGSGDVDTRANVVRVRSRVL